jgi:hypothetical protein
MTEKLRPLREIRVPNVSNLDFEKTMTASASPIDETFDLG